MPNYVPHHKVSLRNHPEFSEKWLQARIADDPSILGLGEVEVKASAGPASSGSSRHPAVPA
jgi:hypothetical protein